MEEVSIAVNEDWKNEDGIGGVKKTWQIHNLGIFGLSSNQAHCEHYLSVTMVKFLEYLEKQLAVKGAIVATGSSGVGKSTTLVGYLNTANVARHGFLWIHADPVKFTIVLRKKNSTTEALSSFSASLPMLDQDSILAIRKLISEVGLSVDIIVLDGAVVGVRDFFPSLLCAAQNYCRLAIACASFQMYSYSSETIFQTMARGLFRRYTVDSWLEEDYRAAFKSIASWRAKLGCTDQVLLEKLFASLSGAARLNSTAPFPYTVEECLDSSSGEGILRQRFGLTEDEHLRVVNEVINSFLMPRFYYAGGNMRLMLADASAAKSFLENKFAESIHCASLLEIIMSEYVIKKLSKAVSIKFVEQAALTLPGNPSWQGWVFELRMLVLLRTTDELSLTRAANGERVSIPGRVVFDDFATNGFPESQAFLLLANKRLLPEKFNQATFDLVHVHSEMNIDFFQFTTAEKRHEYKMQYVAQALSVLGVAEGAGATVRFFVVIPHSCRDTFRVVFSDIQCSNMIRAYDSSWPQVGPTLRSTPSSSSQPTTAESAKLTVVADLVAKIEGVFTSTSALAYRPLLANTIVLRRNKKQQRLQDADDAEDEEVLGTFDKTCELLCDERSPSVVLAFKLSGTSRSCRRTCFGY
eukprot:gene30457-36807_t